jgi:hypothetical protein
MSIGWTIAWFLTSVVSSVSAYFWGRIIGELKAYDDMGKSLKQMEDEHNILRLVHESQDSQV